MEVHDAKIRNTAKDLIIGIGGLHIKGAIDSFHKVHVEKVWFLSSKISFCEIDVGTSTYNIMSVS